MQTITVKQLNLFVKSLIEGDVRLSDVYLKGEISNFKNHYASGHWYFTLKDQDAAIRCVMFRGYTSSVKFLPQDGLQVVLRGRVSLYEKDGQYQFYAEEMHPDGIGDIALAFEQVKQRLAQEGLLSPDNKRPIPKFPQSIAVITSDTGAAVQDIFNIITRRWKLCDIIMCPVSVQGDNAVPEMLDALDRVYTLNNCDLIIIGRGGGSIEDLWAFNSEELARKIFESPVPVISAVGHETDFTICDLVADLRAPTPSAAAELAVPDEQEVYYRINACRTALSKALTLKLNTANLRLSALENSACLKKPTAFLIDSRKQTVDSICDTLLTKYSNLLSCQKTRIAANIAALDALSPLKVLARGFAVVESRGKTISSVNDVETGDKLLLTVTDGTLSCTVDSKGEKHGK